MCKACNDRLEARCEDSWERMRTLATITVQPHVKKRLAPKDLLPLPWDKKRKPVTLQEDKARLERLMRKRKKG